MKTTLRLLKIMTGLMIALFCFSTGCFIYFNAPIFIFWMVVQAAAIVLALTCIWNSDDLITIENSML